MSSGGFGLLTIKIQQMTIESTNDKLPTAPAITYSGNVTINPLVVLRVKFQIQSGNQMLCLSFVHHLFDYRKSF